MKEIPYLKLTMGMQGGLVSPTIVRLARWYGVEDKKRRPAELDGILQFQRAHQSLYGPPKLDKYWHHQTWVWKKWFSAPRITWAEVLVKARRRRQE